VFHRYNFAHSEIFPMVRYVVRQLLDKQTGVPIRNRQLFMGFGLEILLYEIGSIFSPINCIFLRYCDNIHLGGNFGKESQIISQ